MHSVIIAYEAPVHVQGDSAKKVHCKLQQALGKSLGWRMTESTASILSGQAFSSTTTVIIKIAWTFGVGFSILLNTPSTTTPSRFVLSRLFRVVTRHLFHLRDLQYCPRCKFLPLNMLQKLLKSKGKKSSRA